MNLGTTTKTMLSVIMAFVINEFLIASFLMRYINTKDILAISVLVNPPHRALIFKIINENRELDMKWDFVQLLGSRPCNLD